MRARNVLAVCACLVLIGAWTARLGADWQNGGGGWGSGLFISQYIHVYDDRSATGLGAIGENSAHTCQAEVWVWGGQGGADIANDTCWNYPQAQKDEPGPFCGTVGSGGNYWLIDGEWWRE